MAEEKSEWDSLLEESYRYMEDQQAVLEKDFDLSKHEWWDFDQDAGTLIFSNNEKPAVIAEFQFVGSFSSETRTWLWAWANSTIEPKLYEKLETVFRFGEERSFNKLTDDKWDAEEVDGWEMTAIVAYLLKAKGVYRPPFGNGYTFMIITDIYKVSG